LHLIDIYGLGGFFFLRDLSTRRQWRRVSSDRCDVITSDAAQHLRRRESSVTELWKPQSEHFLLLSGIRRCSKVSCFFR